MMKLHHLAYAIAFGGALLSGQSHAGGGSFNTLSYNIAGIPFEYSGANATLHTPIISCYVKPFAIVNVQEDFNWHADLYNDCDNHLYRTPTSGGIGFGDGLNTLSNFPFDDLDRVTWTNRADADALTPKGFTMVRVRLAEGTYLDVYNLHGQSGTSSTDLADSVSDVNQMLGYIESNSAGNAIMVLGDTNTRYTRVGQNMWEFLHHGFSDAWIQDIRNGGVPAVGGGDLVCGSSETARPDCEITDKVLWRSNGFLNLQAPTYVDHQDAVDSSGTQLSDHHPIEVDWTYTTAASLMLSDQFGGPHGTSYNDSSALPLTPVVKQLTIQTGNRVDHVEIALSNGYVFSHGGTGGTAQTLTLGSGEVLSSVNLCIDQYQGHTRVFSINFATSAGRHLSGGTTTSNCTTYAAPAGWQITGFHGRSGDGVDKLGVVYAPVSSGTAPTRQALRLVNRSSSLCMDVSGGTIADGTAVIQWSCNGGVNQTWSYDDQTGMIRSMADPHYCLDNNGTYGDGAQLIIWTCTGNNNQRFKYDSSAGTIAVRSYPTEVIGMNGTSLGNQLVTATASGAATQAWTLTQ
ncbi:MULTISPECIES: jacalin-like lectin [unclassified Bradyrhizobium]|uniref:jacalin-like lectin n=2 Tax=unclassified Bradyrhizobium TaxID=2631580 RepID=UPI0028F055AA|nr:MULTISPECIES: ricin-type beta-trefoil lectin domain protein [unclassified Bradyrhizobium]